jgi:hypothetical protein
MRKVDRKCHSVDLEGRDKKKLEFNCATGKIEIIEFFVTILAAVFEIRDFEISVKYNFQ